MDIYIFLFIATSIKLEYVKTLVRVVPGCTSSTAPGDLKLVLLFWFFNDI